MPDNQADSILITGAGVITCLGLDRHAVWEAVQQGRCGIGPLTALEQPAPDGKHGGQAPELPADEAPGEPREVRYLRRAMSDALRDAGISTDSLPYPPERCGLMMGTTLHGMRAAGDYLRTGETASLGRFLAASVLRSTARGFGIEGFAATTCSACSSSLGAIAMGVTLLQEGKLDLVIAGGYDPVSEYVYAGFNSLRLVADLPLRPFARDRQGMKLAEGYAVVVLERSGDAQRRSAPVLATVLGFGESADAHHLTQPHPQGDGAARAIRQALDTAGCSPRDIGLIVAHATGTPDNDAGEYAAMSRVFGDALPASPVVGFKSHVGHTLGGAGAVELVLAAMAMKNGIIPPCANVNAEDIDFQGLTLATGMARPANIRATLSTSLGFGGANTCMVLGPADSASSQMPGSVSVKERQPRERRDVFITGVGVVLPRAIGNAAFVELLARPITTGDSVESGPIADDAIAHLINARRVRRMSAYVKLMLAAATLAFQDAGITDTAEYGQTCCAVLGSSHGGTEFSGQYYRQLVDQGIQAGNPMLFSEGVPNAGAAHVSLTMSIKGACQTIIGSRTAGLDALALASMRIGQGLWDRVLVGAGEEYGPIVTQSYRNCMRAETVDGDPEGPVGFATGCGAVSLLLESRRSVEARGGRILGRVEASSFAALSENPAAAAVRVLRELGDINELVISRSGTILDRIERQAVRLAYGEQTKRPPVTSLYGRITECYSAGPLAAVAAAVLNGGISAERPGGPIGITCADVTGGVTGVRVRQGDA